MKVEEILFWILFFVGIIVFLWALLGRSPTFEQGLLIFILAMVVKNSISIKGLNTELHNLKKQFNALAADFKEHIKNK